MTARAFTEVQEKEVVLLYRSGTGTDVLASRFCVTDVTIRNCLKRCGVEVRNSSKRLDEVKEKRIVKLYQSGQTCREVARSTGTTHGFVSRILGRNGVKAREARRPFVLPKDKRLEVAMSYADGMTMAALAEAYRVSVDTIFRCLKEFGVVSRTGWGAYKSQEFTDRKNRVFVFKSDWELRYAKYLDSKKLDWEYEPIKFVLKQRRVYTPDFAVTTKSGVEYHEIKGWLDDGAIGRIVEFARLYPKIRLHVIGPAEMVKLGLVDHKYERHAQTKRVANMVTMLREQHEEE